MACAAEEHDFLKYKSRQGKRPMLLLKNSSPLCPTGLSLAGMEPAGPNQLGKALPGHQHPPSPGKPPPCRGGLCGDRRGGQRPPPAPQHLLTSGSDEGRADEHLINGTYRAPSTLPVIGGFLSLLLLLMCPPWQGVRGGTLSLGITGEPSGTGGMGTDGTARGARHQAGRGWGSLRGIVSTHKQPRGRKK